MSKFLFIPLIAAIFAYMPANAADVDSMASNYGQEQSTTMQTMANISGQEPISLGTDDWDSYMAQSAVFQDFN